MLNYVLAFDTNPEQAATWKRYKYAKDSVVDVLLIRHTISIQFI